MNIESLRGEIEALDAEIRSLHQTEDGELREFSPEEQTAFDGLTAKRASKFALLERHEAIANAAQMPERVVQSAPAVHIKRGAVDILTDRSATPSAIAEAAMRALEDKIDDDANAVHVSRQLKAHSRDTEWARGILARSTDAYESGWLKAIKGREWSMTDEERTVLGVTTNANGAYFLPSAIDPTLILTGDLSDNVYRQLGRKVTITNGATNWEGLTSAGMTASIDGEVVEVSDDSPTFGNVSIPTYRAQAFAQASLSALEDISGLQNDLLQMFAEARDNLEGSKFATGSGSSEPTGVWTAVAAITASRVTSTTAATIGLVDLDAVYNGVPRRYRRRSTWTLNPIWALAIKDLGTAVSASYSGDLRDGTSGTLLSRPVVETDDAPEVVTTTALDQRVLLGDFNQFVVVDRPGSMAVEFIPHLFNTTTNLPDGRRGWFATWRFGSGVTNTDAFRVLVDKTSA